MEQHAVGKWQRLRPSWKPVASHHSRALAARGFSRRAAMLAALGKNLCGPEMLVHRLAALGARCLEKPAGFSLG